MLSTVWEEPLQKHEHVIHRDVNTDDAVTLAEAVASGETRITGFCDADVVLAVGSCTGADVEATGPFTEIQEGTKDSIMVKLFKHTYCSRLTSHVHPETQLTRKAKCMVSL